MSETNGQHKDAESAKADGTAQTSNAVFSHACDPSQPLARRLGVTVHVSPLRMRLRRLMAEHPSVGAACVEDWLLDVAQARGVRSVTRGLQPPAGFRPPALAELSTEELVAAITQPQNLDRPQILRAAAELVSRGAVEPSVLAEIACRERADRVLAELARQALHVEPAHSVWRMLADALGDAQPLRSPLLHWTRIAFPVPDERGVCRGTWRLVA
jgi:hypothetical protein